MAQELQKKLDQQKQDAAEDERRSCIVLVGPPGCGKGTQGDKIAECFGLQTLSTGDLLRKEMQKNTKLGQEIAKAMHSHNLLSNNLVESELFNHFDQLSVH